MSITAINADSIQNMGITNEADLQLAAPGLVVYESVGNNNYTFIIRGETVDPYSSSPPAVLVYFNDVNVVPHFQSSYFDIGSVQVLKGPQGTLFGRNTTGGAVLYQTQQPGDQFGGYVLAREGSYSSTQAPNMAIANFSFAASAASGQQLPARLLEIVRLRIAFHNQCRSCMAMRYGAAVDDHRAASRIAAHERDEEAARLEKADRIDIAGEQRLADRQGLRAKVGPDHIACHSSQLPVVFHKPPRALWSCAPATL